MRCQEQEGEGDHVPGLGTRTGSTLLFSTTMRFYDIKQRRNCSFFDCYNKLNDPIVGSLVRDASRIFHEFIVGIKSYMEVSSKTSDH